MNWNYQFTSFFSATQNYSVSNIFCLKIYFTVVDLNYYEAEVVSEYVIKGNTAVLKCNIPSFVADFVRVEAWIGSDGTEFTSTTDFGTILLSQ